MEPLDRKWGRRFLGLAEHVAEWSKDPSTKCGAVIVRPDRTVLSVGYNGFPRGTDDADALYEDRDEKYKRIVHCEMNAILTAHGQSKGCTLYTWPFLSCHRCAVHVIQAGIVRAVAPVVPPELRDRWADNLELTKELFAQSGVEWIEYV